MLSRKRLGMAPIILLCVLSYGAGAVRLGGRVLSVDVDLSRPVSIVSPLEVSIVGDMGETGLRIPPKAGAGWRGEVGGEAVYRFYVPEAGKYYLWIYGRWFDQCTNAMYAAVDKMNKAIVGNDPVYQQWHWVRGFAVRLKKGAHALTLSNHSDHVAVQKVRFINSDIVLPDNCSVVFSDVFYDGFDGCHIGNFASWEPVSGDWRVEKPDETIRYAENALLGQSATSAAIFYEGSDWSDYTIQVAVRLGRQRSPEATAGVLFAVQGPDSHYRLTWTWPDETATVQMRLGHRSGAHEDMLASVDVPWSIREWHVAAIVMDRSAVRILLDGREQLDVPARQDSRGGIGLCLEGACDAHFDEVHVHHVTRE